MDKQVLAARLMATGVPSHTATGLARYVVEGKPTSGFLKAVLEDKLTQSLIRADEDNLDAMFEIVSAIHNDTPIGCSGSPEKVDAWIAKGGLTALDNGRGDTEYDKKRDDELTEVEV